MLSSLRNRWQAPGGYKDVLRVGLPLVVSLGSTTLMEFTDRVFLSHYSEDAIAASMPAAMANLTFLLFFIGVGSYANVFIAQYSGAAQRSRVGAALWQAIYFSIFGAVVLAAMAFFAEPIFRLAGHSESVFRQEVIYFRILSVGSGLALAASCIGCFFSGRGITKPNMVVNLIATAINVPLDYMLIFGVGPFPEMGIAGAGIATASSWGMQLVMYCWLVFTKENDCEYAVWRSRAFDPVLFRRMMRFGLPSGVNSFFDLFAVGFFIFIVGRLGSAELAASNIVFSLDTVAFLPMIGLNIAISTLVGQALGSGKPDEAVRATSSTLHIAMLWMGTMALLFITVPGWLLDVFRPQDMNAAWFAEVQKEGVVLLRFVACYSLLSSMALIYFGAVRGAGDTHYVMWAIVFSAIMLLAVPLLVAQMVFDAGLNGLWAVFTLYVVVLSAIAYRRFHYGPWKTMLVIEREQPEAAVTDDTDRKCVSLD
jgi:MATE family multidrug resistance protein